MGVEIRQVGECFAGEVTGIDLTEPLSTENVNAIHEGMDKYAVLTFREQPLTAEEQLAFSKQLGDIEHAIGTSLQTKMLGFHRLLPMYRTSTRRTGLLISTIDGGYLP